VRRPGLLRSGLGGMAGLSRRMIADAEESESEPALSAKMSEPPLVGVALGLREALALAAKAATRLRARSIPLTRSLPALLTSTAAADAGESRSVMLCR
jgi:hypothetical protein